MQQIIFLDYEKCFKELLRKLPFAVFVAFLCSIACAIACFYLVDKEDVHSARSSVLTRSTNEYGNAAEGVQYAELVKSLTVAERAARILGDGALSAHDIYDMVWVSYDNTSPYVTSSAVINIFAESTGPAEAVRVANAVAQAFVDEVNLLVRRETDVVILDRASAASVIYRARRTFLTYIAVAAAGGFLLVCGLVVLLEILAFRLRAVGDGTLNGKLEIIGVIPDDKAG